MNAKIRERTQALSIHSWGESWRAMAGREEEGQTGGLTGGEEETKGEVGGEGSEETGESKKRRSECERHGAKKLPAMA
jgi:hypothetical protein